MIESEEEQARLREVFTQRVNALLADVATWCVARGFQIEHTSRTLNEEEVGRYDVPALRISWEGVQHVDRTAFVSARDTGPRLTAFDGSIRSKARGVAASAGDNARSTHVPSHIGAFKRSRCSREHASRLEIARIAYGRVVLLAPQYASAVSTAEITARLEILNRRLLDQAPRISREQVRALEEAEAHVSASRAAREARSRRLAAG